MNVIICNDYAYVRGGADLIPILSAQSLADMGCNVVFFAGSGTQQSHLLNNKRIKVIRLNDIDLSNPSSRLKSSLRLLWNNRSASSLNDLLKSFSPKNTVVHIHGWTKSLTMSLSSILSTQGYQPVVTIHDYFLACPNGAFFDFKEKKICHRMPLSLSCICANCDSRAYTHKIWRVFRQFLQQNISRFPKNFKYFIFNSKYSQSLLHTFLPAHANSFLVKNPIDSKKKTRTLAERNLIYLFIGRFTVEKGPQIFAQAASDLQISSLFVGDGYLKRHLKESFPKCKILSWQDRSGISRLLRKARCLVFPSIWHECAPLVVGEALSNGIPVITSDLSAATEQVKDNINGLHYSEDNINDLKSKIIFTGDDTKIKEMSLRAYKNYWNSPMTPDRHASCLIKIYNKIMKDQCEKAQF